MSGPPEHTFVVQRYTRREALLLGWALIVFGVVLTAFVLVDRFEDRAAFAGLLGCGLFLIGCGVQTLRRRAKPRQTVTTTAEALVVDGRRIAWREIDGLRAVRGGIALLGGGRRLATLSAELDDPALVTGIVMKNIDVALEPRRRIVARYRPLSVAGVVLSALFGVGLAIWFLRSGMTWIGWGTVAFLVWLGYEDLRKWAHRLEFDDAALRVRYGLGSRTIPRGDVESFDVIVTTGEVYAVAFLREGRFVALRMPGVDPFEIYQQALRAYPKSVA